LEPRCNSAGIQRSVKDESESEFRFLAAARVLQIASPFTRNTAKNPRLSCRALSLAPTAASQFSAFAVLRIGLYEISPETPRGEKNNRE
jgi:hypothetical protein